MVDLHLHTTASDGLCTPGELVERARAAGVTAISVTDHDTTAAIDEVRSGCAEAGLGFVPGIEITAVDAEVDVHILGYYIDPESPGLSAFLVRQRQDRTRRFREMAARLVELGVSIDAESLLAEFPPAAPVGRPQLARALVRAGVVASSNEAFERWLGRTRPAYVKRSGASPVDVVGLIGASGGMASLAHPGLTNRDSLIPTLVEAGLRALEVYHVDHDADMSARYLELATEFGIGVSGGSDYHGDSAHRRSGLGAVGLSEAQFAAFAALRPRR